MKPTLLRKVQTTVDGLQFGDGELDLHRYILDSKYERAIIPYSLKPPFFTHTHLFHFGRPTFSFEVFSDFSKYLIEHFYFRFQDSESSKRGNNMEVIRLKEYFY